MQILLEWSPKQLYIYEQMVKRNFKFNEFFDEDAITMLNINYGQFKNIINCLKCNKTSTAYKHCNNCYNIICNKCSSSRKTTNFCCFNCEK
jgi:hypothetical protein